ncbi:MAG: efflux RND transporter permease subunit [Breznakibacter sp.]
MNIASFFINRPVFASVVSIIIGLFGIVGFTYLGLREYPSVDPPIVTVTTTYTGANADVIETQITEPLEESINGIAGIRSLTSVSADGRSSITVEFEIEVDMEAAANDVRDRVSRAQNRLPSDCDPPVVVKSDADSDAILIMSVESDRRNLLELSDIAANVLKERLQTISGVSEIRIFGEKRYAMKLLLNPYLMASYGITPVDVRNALNRENVELPSGRIEGYQTDLTVRTQGRLTTVNQFNDLIVKETGSMLVRLKDIGQALLLPENERNVLKGNGLVPMVAVAVIPQPGSNHIAIADEFNKRTEQLQRELPSDIKLQMTLDTTVNIRKAILEVEETIVIAFLLVVVVIFLFLRHWRTTLIPVLAIPISLIGTFFVMYVSGFTINLLTLLGIVLATGLVVDDAIVVMENIYKKIEDGMDPIEAGHKGSKEIIFAIISTTITLVAVFMPIVFLQGITGRLFREFGVVLAGSVVISAVVSLTLTPMMSARLLHKTSNPGRLYQWSERIFERLVTRYGTSLKWFLKRRSLAFVVVAASVAVIFGLGILLPSELAPMEDKSRFRINMTAPEGTAYEAMSAYMDTVTALVDTLPEKEVMIAITGWGGNANSGFIRLGLYDPTKRNRSQQEVADWLNGQLQRHNFARAYALQEQTISTSRQGGLPIQMVVLAPNFEKLREYLPSLVEKAQSSNDFQVVDVNLKFNKPELRVDIDREKAQTLGISVRDVAENLQLYYSGQRYGYFVMNDKQYQVFGLAERQFRDTPSDLGNLYVRSGTGDLVPMSNVLSMSEQSSPPQKYRYNRYVSATISAQPASGVSLGEGIGQLQALAKEVLPDDFATTLTGTSRDFTESSSSLLYAFVFALVLIFLILAAQFESYRDPFIIMFTVPLAIAGAVLSLWMFGQSINIFSQIGIIVLIGIVTKNGILIVEFANQRKHAGLSVAEAVVDASVERLRPILMTSMATVLGALPIALALGAAAKSRVPMGISVIGGLMFSLVLTLYVIPALYTYLSKEKRNGVPETPNIPMSQH